MPLISRRTLLATLPGAMSLPSSARANDSASKYAGATPKLYYSDYFSFVGRDETGFVYLAHDNNRGRTGEEYFADHWIAMYDEVAGWIAVKGSAHYPNSLKALDWIPPSEHFEFAGKPETGVRMVGRGNDMVMTVGPLPRTLYRENADGIFWIGGAPATLEWKGRRLEGRVVFEYLQRHNYNRFTSDFGANWRNFNGLYLMTDRGRDFYVHYHERQGGSDLSGKLVGMASWGTPAPVIDLDFRIVVDDAVPYRTYRLPVTWLVSFRHGGKPYTLMLTTLRKQLFADWEKGGFFMSIVRGVIASEDRTERYGVDGWAELLI